METIRTPNTGLLKPYINEQSALEALQEHSVHQSLSGAQLSLALAYLAKKGYNNLRLRTVSNIPQNYVVSHYRRIGQKIELVVLQLWQQHAHKISFGHMRALTKIPRSYQESICRDILAKGLSVRQIELLSHKPLEPQRQLPELKKLTETLSEQLGRPVELTVETNQQSGLISLKWFGLDDFEVLCEQLGLKIHS